MSSRPLFSFSFLAHKSIDCSRPPHSENEWKRVLGICGWRCFYCACLVIENHTKDHLVPLFRGGCGCIRNLVPACLRCNSMKKQRTVEEFLRYKPALLETYGQFSTTINALNPETDPLHCAIRRLAVQKRMPSPVRPSPELLNKLRRQA